MNAIEKLFSALGLLKATKEVNFYSWCHQPVGCRPPLCPLHRFKNWDRSQKNLDFWILMALRRCDTEDIVLPAGQEVLFRQDTCLLPASCLVSPSWPISLSFAASCPRPLCVVFKPKFIWILSIMSASIVHVKCSYWGVEFWPKRVLWPCLFVF